MKEALAAWAEWYKEGIINSNFSLTNGDKLNEDAVNGKVGIYPFKNWVGWSAGTDMISNLGRDAYMEAYPVPSANGEKVRYRLNCDNFSYIVVSKDCKNPEAAMKCINFYAHPEKEGAAEGMSQEEILSYFNIDHAAQVLRVQHPNLTVTPSLWPPRRLPRAMTAR